MQNQKNEKGFTMIELLIVVAIIGILSAVAMPLYQKYLARSQLKEAAALGASMKPLVEDYLNTKGAFPATANLTAIGLPVDNAGAVIGVQSATLSKIEAVAAGQEIKITLKSTDIRPEVQGTIFTYKKNAATATDPGVWVCSITPPATGGYTDDLTPPGCTKI